MPVIELLAKFKLLEENVNTLYIHYYPIYKLKKEK